MISAFLRAAEMWGADENAVRLDGVQFIFREASCLELGDLRGAYFSSILPPVTGISIDVP